MEEQKLLSIPKIIHQVWEGKIEKNIPNHLQILSDSWKECNPNWGYKLWSYLDMEELVYDFFPEYSQLYHNFEYDVQRWDTIRYMILFQYGGVYTDLDTECYKSLDNLLDSKICCFGEEPYMHWNIFSIGRIIGNAFMASVPQNNIFNVILDEITKSIKKYTSEHVVLNTTGPLMITRLMTKGNCDKFNINLLPYQDVAPLSKQEVLRILEFGMDEEMENKIKHSICAHYFFGSWDKQLSLF